MKRFSPAVHLALFAASLLVCGCRTAEVKAPAPRYMTEAIMQSLADIFDGSWGGVTVYLQKNAWVPDDLKKIGQNAAQVTSVDELMKKQYDLEKAPAITVIDAREDSRNVIQISVSYRPLQIKGLEPETKGGDFEYTYKLIDGNPVMISRMKSFN